MAKKITSQEIIDNDVFGNLRKSAEETQAKVIMLETSLKAIKTTAETIKNAIPKTAPTDSKGIAELNALQKQANDTARAKLTIDKQLIKEKVNLQMATKAKNDAVKQEIALERSSVNTYSAKSATLNALRKQYKDLALQNKENTKEAKALLAQITPLDAKLKAIDKSVGQSQRNVGNYGSALDGLKGKFRGLANVAGQFGLALGGVAIVKSAIDTIRVYEDAIADLSAITGATGKDLDFFKQKSIELGVNVKGGAASVVEAYKLIASAKPELLENAEALNSVTEAAILLSKASGMELPLAATALTDAMNQFGAGADQAGKFVDVLAAGAKFGSAEIPQITEALLKFGAVAKTTNVNIQESTGLIEALAEKGLKGAEAGTALRNVMLKLSAPDALPKEAQERMKALGINFDALKDKSKPFSERLEALKPLLNDNAALIKVFGTENAVAATTLLTSTDRIKELTASVDENGVALEQQNAKSKTLSEAFNRLKETWNGFILNLSNGAGAASGAASAIDFLARNLGTILKVVGQLIKLWIIYKTVTAALKLRESALEWNNNRKAIKETGDALKEGSSGAKAFGSALKGIGLSVAIGLLTELGMKFRDVASGAEAARDKMALFNAEMAKGSKFGSKYTSTASQEMDDELKLLDLRRASEKLSEESYLLEKKRIIANGILKIQTMKTYALEDRKRKKEEMESQKRLYDYQMTLNPFIRDQAIISGYEIARASYLGLGKEINEYDKFLREAKNTVTDNTIATIENSNASKESAKDKKAEKEEREKHEKYIRKETQAIEEQAAARDLLDPEKLERALALENERLVLGSDIALIEAQITLEKAKQIGNTDAILKAEEAVLQAKIKQIEAQRDLDLKGTDNVNEQDKIRKQSELDILNLQSEQKEEIAKKDYENAKKYIDLSEKLFTSNIDKKIAKIDEEIAAHKKLSDTIRELANSGNIEAKESLAEQERLEAQAIAKRERLEKRKQRLQMAAAFLTSYTNALESGKQGFEALAVATVDKALLESIIESLPTFLEGTDNTGKGGNLDKDGGFLSVLHPGERVMTKEQNNAIGTLTNAEVVSKIQMAKISELGGNIAPSGWENTAIIAELSGLKTEIQSVKKAIENKPQTNIELGEIYQNAFSIVKTTKQGNKVTNDIFRVS